MLLLGILFALFVFALLIIYSTFSWGLVLYFFWYWFLKPVFPDLPEIEYWQAVGLMLFVNLFKNKTSDIPIKEEHLKMEQKTTVKIVSYLGPWLTLLVGWFVQFVLTII